MTNEEKQELVRKVWIVSTILMIAGIIGFFTGYWFFALCFIGVALAVEKKIEEVFSSEISNAKEKMFDFFDAVYEKVEPTWFGRFLNKIFSASPAVINNLEETELGSVSESGISDMSATFSSVSTRYDTRGIYFGLRRSISSEFLELPTESESEQSGYDGDSESYNKSVSRTELSIGSDDWPASPTDLDIDDEEDFVELTENDDQLGISSQELNKSNLQELPVNFRP